MFGFRPGRRAVQRGATRHKPLGVESLESRLPLCGTHHGDLISGPASLADDGLLVTSAGTEPGFSLQLSSLLVGSSTSGLTFPDGPLPQPSANATGLPVLNSLPGAPTAIYLDFDGHGSTLGAYDVDGDPTTFNTTEQSTITEAHRGVSVFFSMFDVNVTTVKPTGPFAWIVISNDVTGGTSFVDVFPNTQPESWVASSVAQTRIPGIVHELGHNFGLLHQSDYDLSGKKTEEYTRGYDSLHGSIMGADASREVAQWTLGHPSDSASALQDDVQVIANAIKRYQPAGGDGFRADDFGDTIATATALTAASGARSVTGIIERLADVDTFSFTTAGGGAMISVIPTRPSGLDAKLEVFDAAGTLVAASDGADNTQQLLLPVGTGTWYVSVSSSGNYADLGAYDLTVNDLPEGWWSADIGNTGFLGNARFGGETFTLAGSGATVGGTSDAFRFAWQKLTGDGSITARVTQNQNTDAWAKAGVEIRESLAANSKHVAMVTTATQGPQMLFRTTNGGITTAVNDTAAPFTATWVRLVRTGNLFTAFRSADGVAWDMVGSVTIAMAPTVHIGLLSSAADAGRINTARFTDVTLTGALNRPEALAALAPPAGVTLRQGGGASFVVSWQPVSGATGYEIERSDNGVDFSTVFTAESSDRSWLNTGLPGGIRYYFRVRATSAAGRSAASAVVSEINRPSPVTNAAVTTLSNSQLVLNWRDTSGETGYRIEQSIDNVTFTQLATIGTNLPSHTVGGLAAGTTYWFRISPMSGTGDGNPVVISGSTTGLQSVRSLAFTSKAPTAIGLEWTAVGAATSYRIERSTNGTSFTALTTVPAGTLTYTDTSVAVLGRFYYQVVAIHTTGPAVASPTIFTAAPAAVALPSPWTGADVGSVAGEGATGLQQSSKFVLVSSGTAIGGPADSFRFMSQPLVGNGTIIARVTLLENTGGWAKAGIMIRESADVNARQAVMVVTPSNGVAWQYRHNPGGSGLVFPGPTTQTVPVWVRLVREGNRFTGSWSTDGVTWTEAGSTDISMVSSALIGLVSTSDAATRLGRAEFTDVAVTIPTTDQAVTVAAGQTASEPGGRAHAGGLIKRGPGRLVLSGANAHTGGTVVEAGELVIRNPSALGTGGLVVRAGARVTLDLGAGRLALSRLDLAAAGTLDLATGSVRLAPGTYDVASIRSLILAGRGDGSWTVPGITSAAAAASGGTRTVGYRVEGDGSLSVAFAAPGDTNLDGAVDLLDLLEILGSGTYEAAVPSAWSQGDSTYDGTTDLLDLLAILGSGAYDQGTYLPSSTATAGGTSLAGLPTDGILFASAASLNLADGPDTVIMTAAVAEPEQPTGYPQPTLGLPEPMPQAMATVGHSRTWTVRQLAWAALAEPASVQPTTQRKSPLRGASRASG